jgi:hypothetical protein
LTSDRTWLCWRMRRPGSRMTLARHRRIWLLSRLRIRIWPLRWNAWDP